ncbi:MAG: helix-turn-helix domain-containing protein [Oligoflexia bacterium]|nr:helix-turn-helix domain-containing protein [Oligoflexia bacterium]
MATPRSKHVYRQFGEFLRSNRDRANLSQVELANRLGYTSQFISNCERGKAVLPGKSWKTLIQILKVTEGDLLEILHREQEAVWVAQIRSGSKKSKRA